ncbi:bidirectional sugar transporter SWEET4-like [Humulus lupulus]|uniref:bidirectional sugar transporter SWEET4-like n=1 Tax=Humulus lupulus TaxID=3486 RepID=UPI002B40B070|nr:bidirectional sugar transporter SWEET4-like [Humulus lupulus]
MVSADAARTFVGILGNIISLFFFLSPMPTMVDIWRKGSVEQYSAAPYLATLMNCLLWGLYGLPLVHPGSLLVLTINAAGIVIQSCFIFFFFLFSQKKTRLKLLMVLLMELIFTSLLAFLALNLLHTHPKRSLVIGIICIFFNILMYFAPMAIMKLVITTKSVEYMPFFLSLATFVNGCVWTAYALIRFDPIIMVPNGLGLLFGLGQLIIYALFYKSTKKIIAARKVKEEDLPKVVVVKVLEVEEEPNKSSNLGL